MRPHLLVGLAVDRMLFAPLLVIEKRGSCFHSPEQVRAVPPIEMNWDRVEMTT